MADHFGNISISPSAPKEPSPPKKRKKARKQSTRRTPTDPTAFSPGIMTGVFLLCLLLGAYSILGFRGVPKLLSSRLPEDVRSATELDLTIDTIRFNPFTFTLELEQTTLSDPKTGNDTLLSISDIEAKLAPISLLRGDFVTTRLDIVNMNATAVRKKGGGYNFTPILESFRKSDKADFMDFSELPFLFSLNNITVTESKALFIDIPNNSRHTVENIRITLPNLSNFPYETGHYIQPAFSAIINGSPVELTSQTSFAGTTDSEDRKKTELACNINDIDISLYFSYLPAHLPFIIEKGKANGIVKLSFTPGAKDDKVLTEFSLKISELQLADIHNKFFLTVPSSDFEGSVHPITGDTHLKQILLENPEFQVKKGHLLELSRLLSFRSHHGEATSTARKPPELTIDRLIADNGTFSNTKEEKGKKKNRWQSIRFDLKHFTTASDTEGNNPEQSFSLNAEQTEGHAVINWQGSIGPDNIPEGSFRLSDIATDRLFEWIETDFLGTPTGTADLESSFTFLKGEEEESTVNVVLQDGSLILHDLTLTDNGSVWYSAPVTKFQKFAKKGSKIQLGDIILKNGDVSLNSAKLPQVFHALVKDKGDLTFSTLDFSGAVALKPAGSGKPSLSFDRVRLQALPPGTNEEEQGKDNLTLEAELKGKGEIQAKGKLTLHPFSTVLSTAFTKLPGKSVLPWFGNSKLLTRTSGTLSGQGTFIFPEVSFNGRLSLAGGRYGTSKNSYLRWKEFSLQDARFKQVPFYFGGSEITFKAPELTVNKTSSSLHPIPSFLTFLNEQLPDTVNKKKKGVNLPSIEIQKLSVVDGKIHYREDRLAPPWLGEVTFFRGTVDNIVAKRGGGSPSSFSFSGNLDTIPFSLEGTINMFDRDDQGNSLFNMKDYPFPSFHEQLADKVDIETNQGRFSLTTRSDWNKGVLNEQSQLLFENIRPTSTEAPTALTLSLLTDTDRKFELLVGRKHDFSKPSEPLLTATLTKLRKLMIKASVSPYLVASGDYSDMAGNEFAEFLPGQIALSGNGRESLTLFSRLLSNHPHLGIVITGAADRKVDGAALQEEQEQAEMERIGLENTRRKEAYEEALASYRQKLEDASQDGDDTTQIFEQDLPSELLKPFTPISPEPVVIDTDILNELAKGRARVIVDFFTSRLALDPERITIAKQSLITDSMPDGANKVLFTLRAHIPKEQPARQDTPIPEG